MEGLIVDTDTFVIVGAWNREILSQEWVMQNLRRRDGSDVSLHC